MKFKKKQVIFEAETLAAVIAFQIWLSRFANRRCVLFVDSEGTKFSLLRGPSASLGAPHVSIRNPVLVGWWWGCWWLLGAAPFSIWGLLLPGLLVLCNSGVAQGSTTNGVSLETIALLSQFIHWRDDFSFRCWMLQRFFSWLQFFVCCNFIHFNCCCFQWKFNGSFLADVYFQ